MKRPLRIPEIEQGQYLVDAMWKLGPVRNYGLGEIPTDWPEIHAFARCTECISEVWEFEALAEMCRGYVSAKAAGVGSFAVAPVDQKPDMGGRD